MPLQSGDAYHFEKKAAIAQTKSGTSRRKAVIFGRKFERKAGWLCLGFILTLNGCHSAYISATVSNHTAAAISVVQVEYPSASFGTQTIAPGSDFHYRFKVLGSGAMKITYTDTAQHEQKFTGPTLTEGTEGALTVTVAPDGVHWQTPPPAN